MGLSCAQDIFQEKMTGLMSGLEYVRTYLDDILVLSGGTLDDHLEKLTEVLNRLQMTGLRVNIDKCKFWRSKVEYLGYIITFWGIYSFVLTL